MKRDGLLKHLLIAFFAAFAFYLLAFSWMEYRRNYKGPWIVTFLTDPSGQPGILVSQPHLKISGVKILFPEKKATTKNMLRTVRFDAPDKKAPFGEVVFVDTTYLPGTVAFNFFGHEVQLIPRILTIDKREYPWRSGMTVPVTGAGKYQPQPRKQGRTRQPQILPIER